jgi:hypothetical protein
VPRTDVQRRQGRDLARVCAEPELALGPLQPWSGSKIAWPPLMQGFSQGIARGREAQNRTSHLRLLPHPAWTVGRMRSIPSDDVGGVRARVRPENLRKFEVSWQGRKLGHHQIHKAFTWVVWRASATHRTLIAPKIRFKILGLLGH